MVLFVLYHLPTSYACMIIFVEVKKFKNKSPLNITCYTMLYTALRHATVTSED